MSLKPTYVLADDGLWYRNPVIRGIGWYLCFDDIDPAEVVVACSQLNSDRHDGRCAQAVGLLDSVGISTTKAVYCGERSRCFDGRRKPVQSISVFVDIANPIPAILIRGLIGITLERARKKSPCLDFCGTVTDTACESEVDE